MATGPLLEVTNLLEFKGGKIHATPTVLIHLSASLLPLFLPSLSSFAYENVEARRQLPGEPLLPRRLSRLQLSDSDARSFTRRAILPAPFGSSVLPAWGIEPRTSCVLVKHPTTELQPPAKLSTLLMELSPSPWPSFPCQVLQKPLNQMHPASTLRLLRDKLLFPLVATASSL